MAFFRGRDRIVPVNHPGGEANLLDRCRLSGTRTKSARALAAAALAAAGGVLAATAIASAPGEPAALLAPAAPAPADATPAPAALPAPVAVPVASPIGDRINGAADLRIGGEKMHIALLRQFYTAHDFQPVWEGRKVQAEALLRAVARAGDHGLDPELFHAGLLQKLATLSPIDRDLLLSDAFLSFADALARGAVPIEARYDDEDLTPEPVDIAAVLTRALNSSDPAAVIEDLAPRSPAYLALRDALRSYRANGAEAGHAGSTAAPGSGEVQRRAILVNL